MNKINIFNISEMVYIMNIMLNLEIYKNVHSLPLLKIPFSFCWIVTFKALCPLVLICYLFKLCFKIWKWRKRNKYLHSMHFMQISISFRYSQLHVFLSLFSFALLHYDWLENFCDVLKSHCSGTVIRSSVAKC